MSFYRHGDLNRGVGCVPGASASLGYCLGVYITVDGARRKRLLVFLLFLPPCPIFLSPWTWWGVGLRTIAQHWGSSPGSWGLRIPLSVLVLGHFPVKLWAVSQLTRNRNRIGRWPTLKTAISRKVECAQICVPILSSVKVLYITANSRRWWSSEGREAQIHLYQKGAELWGRWSLDEFQPNCLWDAKLNQAQYTTKLLSVSLPLKYRSHQKTSA